MKPFWKSRKFAYAVGTFLAALVLALLPMAVTLDEPTTAMLEQMLPLIFVIGALVITGHTVTDVVAVWKEGVESQTLRDAAHALIEAVPLPERETIRLPEAEGGTIIGGELERDATPH